MKKTLAGVLLAASLPLTSVVTAAPADAAVAITPIIGCSATSIQQGITDLQNAVTSLPITGKNAATDRANLLGKLSAASTKIVQGKPLDAAAKLRDFVAKIDQLAAAGRISLVEAQALTAAATALINCLDPNGVTATA